MPEFIPPNPAYEAAVRQILLAMPYVQWLGLSFRKIAPGLVEFGMPIRPEITFDGKAVQAGPIGALLDFSGGAAAFTLAPAGVMLATIDFSVKLLAPRSATGSSAAERSSRPASRSSWRARTLSR